MKKKKQEEDLLGDPDEEDEEEEMVEGEEIESEDEEEPQTDLTAEIQKDIKDIKDLFLKLGRTSSIQTKWIKKHTEQISKIDDNFKLLLERE